jgi:hypothetical protein
MGFSLYLDNNPAYTFYLFLHESDAYIYLLSIGE